MSLRLSEMFPSIETGLNRVGFLFGAGASKEAGYPLMSDLTKFVVSSLSAANRTTLDEILAAKKSAYEPASGTPDIEALSDLVTEHIIASQDSKYADLESSIRKLIVEKIMSVTDPDLTHHVCFLEALKKRAHGNSSTVTILTTNYDILFELAASEVGIRVETGFDGPLRRVFDPEVFDLARGKVKKQRFSPRPELQINLIKLHGSISWFKDGNRVIESGLGLSSINQERSLILPRRQKVMDTLAEPFDQLFTRSSRMLGFTCKYIASCGFSFGDKHINDQLILPKLREGAIRLTALCETEPDCLDELRRFPSFLAGFRENCIVDQVDTRVGTNLWQFSKLTKLLRP